MVARMSLSVSLESGSRLDEALDALLDDEPHLPGRSFARWVERPDAAARFHRTRWRRAAGGLGAVVVRDSTDRPLATVQLERRAFESTHFGIEMAKIEPPVAVADDGLRRRALKAAYGAAFETLRTAGYAHVVARATAADRATCWTAQELGGFYVGTKISWMAALDGRANDHPIRDGLTYEVYGKDNIAQLDRSRWKRLADWSHSAFDRGPLVNDLGLPVERAGELYGVWTDKAMTCEWADALLLVCDGDEVVSFHSMMVLEDLSAAVDQTILGRGIGGTLPGYQGLFTALQRETIARRPMGATFLEDETQAANLASINVFGRMGHRCLHSAASFHFHLGGVCLQR